MNDEINELNTVHSVQANSSEYFCEGKLMIGKEISLNLASKDLKRGRWDVNPAIVVTGQFDGTAFLARGRFNDALGAAGTVKYETSDDAAFFLDFYVPVSGANTVGIRCEGQNCNLYSCSASRVPETGRSTTPVYTITRK